MQGHQHRVAVFVVGGILRREVLINDLHFSTRLIHVNAWSQATVAAKEVDTAKICGKWVGNVNWSPGISVCLWGSEVGGHYASNRIDVTAERNGLTHNLSIAAKLIGPQLMTQHCDVRTAYFVVFSIDEPAQLRPDTKRLKKPACYQTNLKLSCLAAGSVIKWLEYLAPDLAERTGLCLNVRQIRCRLI